MDSHVFGALDSQVFGILEREVLGVLDHIWTVKNWKPRTVILEACTSKELEDLDSGHIEHLEAVFTLAKAVNQFWMKGSLGAF